MCNYPTAQVMQEEVWAGEGEVKMSDRDEVAELRQVVSELWDTVEGIKHELRSKNTQDMFARSSEALEALEKVTNKKVRTDLERKFRKLEDAAFNQETNQHRFGYKQNPLNARGILGY